MEILKRTKKWKGFRNSTSLLITDERQLDNIIESPYKTIAVQDERGYSLENQAMNEEKDPDCLVDKVKKAKEAGTEIFTVSYDFFFGGVKRTLFPDSEKTIRAFKIIHDVAKEYGMEFSASVINPLDVGGEYIKNHEETGFTWQYREGKIKDDGSFEVPMSMQRQWMNNKGPVELVPYQLIVYAFKEERIGQSSYYYVNPDEILDISDTAGYTAEEEIEYTSRGYGRSKMLVSGCWEAKKEEYDRCLAVIVYRTQELDYFADNALDYLKNIIDLHAEAGITYRSFYSDEMHIQFDWDSGINYGLEEIATRYLTPNFAKEFARRYGKQFEDFGKYLIYFSYNQHDFLEGEEAKVRSQHVFEKGTAGIYKTWLMRKRYFEMLNEKVVSLCIGVKEYAESLFGDPIICFGHATWEESPALDRNYPDARYGDLYDERYSRYDYHPDFCFSSSVIEAIAGCYDYFTWNDYYTGGGTDHAELAYSDRNYYTQAIGTSLAVLNPFDYGYAAGWGSPDSVMRRFTSVGKTYGMGDWGKIPSDQIVQNVKCRLTDVLAIYPMDLLYAEERFGSWMVQYGYCNYITENKLKELGSVTQKGFLKVKENEYRTLVVFFSPFIQKETMTLIEEFVKNGGKVLWMAIPPVMELPTEEQPEKWYSLFGIRAVENAYEAGSAAGKEIVFAQKTGISDMPILTDMLPDAIYPVVCEDAEELAFLDGKAVASIKKYENGGCTVYAGFRVRDDQSQSTGKDISTLFDLLVYMEGYDPEGAEIKSRPKDSRYIYNRFQNGAVSVANHYRTFYEHWDSLFYRDEEKDSNWLKGRELPPVTIEFEKEDLFGHKITYSGSDSLTYRLNDAGELMSFSGFGCNGITIDEKEYLFMDEKGHLIFAPLEPELYEENIQAAALLYTDVAGTVTIPNVLRTADVAAKYCEEDFFHATKDKAVCATGNEIVVEIPEEEKNHWIILYCNK